MSCSLPKPWAPWRGRGCRHLCVSEGPALCRPVEWINMSRPLPEVVSFLQAMPEEEIKPQMAIIHGISTFLTMRRRAVLGGGVQCALKSSHKLHPHKWLGSHFFLFYNVLELMIITVRSTFPKGLSTEFQCQGILLGAVGRHTHDFLIK